MAEAPIQAITKRAPTIDFIDQRLPKHHPLFASQAVHYDPTMNQFVPNKQALTQTNSGSLVNAGASSVSNTVASLQQRPEWTDVDAMVYWNDIFPESMSRFASSPEPKGRSKTPYDIRGKSEWNAVYDTLEMARQKYQMKGGLVGKIRKVRRKAADSITPGAEAAKIASKVVPQDNVATPVVGAIVVVLDALKTASTVRNQILTSFDDLVLIFSDVELFLSTFQGDVNIRNASIDLIATTLAAIEQTIGFYTSDEFIRAGKAIFSGADYQKDLRDSIELIQTKSESLLRQAERSHIFESHLSAIEARRNQAQLLSKVDAAVSATNSINYLLNDHLLEKERHLQQVQRELEAARQENVHLKVENGILRSTSPERFSMWLPPQKQIQGPMADWYVNQSTLRQMIDTFDVDITDGAFILDKKEQLLSKDTRKAEQIVNSPLFRNWIVSASSAKLLVHWATHIPKMVAQVSPLSLFCLTLTQSLRARDQFVSAVWFCGQHVDTHEPGVRTGGRVMLSSLIDQLLRQFEFDTVPLHNEIDLDSLQTGDINILSELLRILVTQLPPTVTLFFIVDGVVLFEREEFEEEASKAFLALIHLVADTSVMAAVKLLFTSTPSTDIIRVAFEQDDLILNVDSLPTLAVASEERMIRELGELAEDGDR